jgi:tape measure domain-containing protein
MSSVDQRVVQMKFDNIEFQKGVKDTLTSLDQLNKGLKLEGATKGINDISTAASRFSLANIASGVENISDRFKALSVIGITALATIAQKAVNAGLQISRSLTVAPILQGYHEYETQLNSIQTILANTATEGTKLKNVTDALNVLNTYADKTIYSFSEMTRNIGTFTAAGVSLQTSVEAIKGIANLAALSGSNAEQASAAMYQLSQAIAANKVGAQDWISVVNAGMGGKAFQNSLFETAKAMGTIKTSAPDFDHWIKAGNTFKDSLKDGWLTGKVLTETLRKFTGDLSDAQLKAMGYNKTQILQIQQMAQNANDAATKVKTFSQLLDTLREAVGSGWATTWQTVFGDFNEAKVLFTNVNNVLSGFINTSAKARNKVLADWKALGGRTALINGIANAFHALMAVVQPIKDAFHDIFPPATGAQLASLSKSFEEFTKHLKIGADTADKIHRTFAGVFAIFKIGYDIVKEIALVFIHVFSALTSGSGAILDTTASIGDFIVGLKNTLESGDKLHKFFQNIAKDLDKPIEKVREFFGWISDAWHGVDKLAKPAVDGLHKALTPLESLGNRLLSIWQGFANVLSAVGKFLKPIGVAIGKFFTGVVDKIKTSFGDIDYDNLFDGLNVGLLAAIGIILKKILSGGLKLDFTGGVFDKIKEAFEGLTGTLKTMQLQLKANALIKIAAAIALLTVSVIALSLIDSKKLTSATAALTVMFTDLLVSLGVFEKITKNQGFVKMPLVTASLIALAIALDLMTIAVKSMSELNWNELSKGLTGLAVVMAVMVTATRLLPKESLISTGAGMVILGASLKIMASAMKDFSSISWADMAKGITGVALVLGALILVSKTMEKSKGGIFEDLEFILLAASIKILAMAVGDFGKLSWGSIAKGLVAMAGALTIMVTAIDLMPPTAALSAAGITVAALGLGKIAEALVIMGKMSWGEIGKSLVEFLGVMTILSTALDIIDPAAPLAAVAIYITALALDKVATILDHFAKMSWGEIGKAMTVLAGALFIIGGALDIMLIALPGAAAMVVVAGALAVLVPVLFVLGKMSWGEIAKGLGALAAVFTVLGIAGLLLAPVVPIIFALSAAIALIGAGVALAGAGVFLFAAGLTALSAAGALGTKVLVDMVTQLAGLIPLVLTKLGEGIVAFAKVIATAGPAFTAAITTVLTSFMDAIIKLTPKIGAVFQVILTLLLDLAVKNIPKMVDAGLKILIGFLNGIANNIGLVITAATNLIVNFLNGISKNNKRVIDAGFNLIITFVNSLADSIRAHTPDMVKAGANLADAIINGMTGGLFDGVGKVVDAAKNVAKRAFDAAKNFLDINSPSRKFIELGKSSSEGIAVGLTRFAGLVETASEGVGKTAIESLKNTLTGISGLVNDNVNLNPVITPVLDLTDVKKSAATLGNAFGNTPVRITASVSSANAAANGFQDNLDNRPGGPDDGQAPMTELNYTQINNSPKALSTADIYRQTKNQLSAKKGELP